LPYDERKRLQIVHASHVSEKAKLVKLADKLYNLRSLDQYIPVGWDKPRAKKYAEWANEVVSQIKGVNETLDKELENVIQRLLVKYS
jgi:(p)ppGpp synthase/HD superfamily hydrolase